MNKTKEKKEMNKTAEILIKMCKEIDRNYKTLEEELKEERKRENEKRQTK